MDTIWLISFKKTTDWETLALCFSDRLQWCYKWPKSAKADLHILRDYEDFTGALGSFVEVGDIP